MKFSWIPSTFAASIISRAVRQALPLSVVKSEFTYDILNPQGYANELLSKTELGQNLFFKDSLAAKTNTDLRNMLRNPNAANIYTEQMIDMIAEEIASRETE